MTGSAETLVLCSVYKSEKVADTYLYVDRSQGMTDVPEQLLEGFGEPIEVLTFKLSEGRNLAQVDAREVIKAIRERGYYLQLPPVSERVAVADEH